MYSSVFVLNGFLNFGCRTSHSEAMQERRKDLEFCKYEWGKNICALSLLQEVILSEMFKFEYFENLEVHNDSIFHIKITSIL